MTQRIGKTPPQTTKTAAPPTPAARRQTAAPPNETVVAHLRTTSAHATARRSISETAEQLRETLNGVDCEIIEATAGDDIRYVGTRLEILKAMTKDLEALAALPRAERTAPETAARITAVAAAFLALSQDVGERMKTSFELEKQLFVLINRTDKAERKNDETTFLGLARRADGIRVALLDVDRRADQAVRKGRIPPELDWTNRFLREALRITLSPSEWFQW